MQYKTKAVVIGRMKKNKDDFYPLFIHVFESNDPHLHGKVPKEFLEYDVEHLKIKGLDVDYFTQGSDIVINNLEFIEVVEADSTVTITGKQKH